jgi:hypothetical protein
MATMYRYQVPVAQTGWTLQGETQTAGEFAAVDADALLEQDNRVAKGFDAGRFVRETLAPDR